MPPIPTILPESFAAPGTSPLQGKEQQGQKHFQLHMVTAQRQQSSPTETSLPTSAPLVDARAFPDKFADKFANILESSGLLNSGQEAFLFPRETGQMSNEKTDTLDPAHLFNPAGKSFLLSTEAGQLAADKTGTLEPAHLFNPGGKSFLMSQETGQIPDETMDTLAAVQLFNPAGKSFLLSQEAGQITADTPDTLKPAHLFNSGEKTFFTPQISSTEKNTSRHALTHIQNRGKTNELLESILQPTATRSPGVSVETVQKLVAGQLANNSIQATPQSFTGTTVTEAAGIQSPVVALDNTFAQHASSSAIQVEKWAVSYSNGNSDQKNLADNVSVKADQNTSTPAAAGNQEQQRVFASIQQPAELEEIIAKAPVMTNRHIDAGSKRQDVNSTYIHSNLPDRVPGISRVHNTFAGQQAHDENNLAKGAQGTMPSEQTRPATGENSGDAPLVFSLDQGRTLGANSNMPTVSSASGQRFVPGTLVPENHIVDQVFDRFSLNRRLESSSVTLKLHPQELGELRMEIKVEQDNIKAHITTQNPQVQEILERHMPKLRGILEQQGLTLQEVKVTVADGNHTDDQLFQGNQHQQSLQHKGERIHYSTLFPLAQPEPLQAPSEQSQSLSVHI